ncbi:MAG: BrnT family toxin [Sphingopyxis sp.]
MFAGLHFDVDDDRRDYGERRCITTGILGDSVVNLVWTPRDGGRRIISMRKARDDERQRYFERLGGP